MSTISIFETWNPARELSHVSGVGYTQITSMIKQPLPEPSTTQTLDYMEDPASSRNSAGLLLVTNRIAALTFNDETLEPAKPTP